MTQRKRRHIGRGSQGAEGFPNLSDEPVHGRLLWRRGFCLDVLSIAECYTQLFKLSVKRMNSYVAKKYVGHATAHPGDLALTIFSEIALYSMHNVLVGKIRIYFGGSCLPGFHAFCLY